MAAETIIQIKGIPPYDGDWELDLDEMLTPREWRWIKQIAGYLPSTLEEGIEGGDPNFVVALTVIALHRAGKITRDEVLAVADKFADVPFDGEKIAMSGGDDEEADALPPVLTPKPGEASLSGTPEREPSSGDDSRNGLGLSDDVPKPIGTTR